jgi:hypothetical protein
MSRLLSLVALLVCAAARDTLPAAFDPYSTLRVPRDVTPDAVRGAYRAALNVLGRAASRHGHGQRPDVDDLQLMQRVGLVRRAVFLGARAGPRARAHPRLPPTPPPQAFRVLTDASWRAEWDAANAAPATPPSYAPWVLDEEDL